MMSTTITHDSTGATQVGGAPTPDQIVQLGLGFWSSETLLGAVELGLFSELAQTGPFDTEALAERLGLHQRSARDFFDALVALWMLARTRPLPRTSSPSCRRAGGDAR